MKPLIEAEKELAQFRAQQSGFSLGLEDLDSTILSFEDKLGREIPGLFADNLGTAIKDAVTGAEDIGDALSKAGESFLGYIRDAFLQQAANQATSAIFGGIGAGGAPGTGGGLFSSFTGAAGGAAGAAAGGAEGEKKGGIAGFFSNLFGGGKKGGGALGSSPTNPLFVQDVANAIGGGAATGAEKALENITGKEGEEQEGFFSKIKNGFGDLFGGLKDKLGGMFSGLKDSLGGLFGGGAGGGGIFSSLLGGLGGIGSGIGGIFSSLLSGFSGGLGSLFSFFNTGGPVGRGTDTVPAMLTPGEFVVKKSAVDKYGTGFLSSLNNGVLPMRGFQNGGSVSPVAAEAGASAMGGNQISNNSDFTFNIQDGKVSQEGGQGSSENQREFASRIRSAVTTVIQEESRSGGTLNYLYKS